MPHKIGLVLSGGGGKGAYEVGVWKALHKFGLTEKIFVISGTSVCALYAAIFAFQDHITVEEVWKSIKPFDIMSVDFEAIVEIECQFSIAML